LNNKQCCEPEQGNSARNRAEHRLLPEAERIADPGGGPGISAVRTSSYKDPLIFIFTINPDQQKPIEIQS